VSLMRVTAGRIDHHGGATAAADDAGLTLSGSDRRRARIHTTLALTARLPARCDHGPLDSVSVRSLTGAWVTLAV